MSDNILRILLVEDTADISDLVAAFLRENYAYKVDTATTFEGALNSVVQANGYYDVALIDDTIPNGPGEEPERFGIELMRRIKDLSPSTESIIFTGWGMDHALEALRAGAYRYLAKPVNLDELAISLRHAVEYHHLKAVVHEKQMLERLVETTGALLSCLNQQELFASIKKGMEATGFERVRLYLLSEDEKSLTGTAHFGMDEGFLGVKWNISSELYEEIFAKNAPSREYWVKAKNNCAELEPLGRDNAEDWVWIPLLAGQKAIGLLAADNKTKGRPIVEEELKPLTIFAYQVAAAIKTSQLFEETKQRADHLEKVRWTTLAIAAPVDRDALLRTIIKQAVELLRANNGGIYEYDPQQRQLTVITDYNRPEHVGTTLKLGEGMSGVLVQSGKPFIIVDDYDKWPGKATIYGGSPPFGAVLEVPLRWQGGSFGVLYIDDEVGRKFTPQDARLLGLFADQAAAVLINADIIAKDEDKLRRLERLSEVTKEIMGNLNEVSLNKRLMLIAKYASEILRAEAAEVLLVKRPGILSLEASYGQIEGSFHKGQEFLIRSGSKTGLTGHIAFEGKLFNARGEELVNHFSVHGSKSSHLPSGECYSLLAIPLKKREGKDEQLVGLLRVENKRDAEGQSIPSLGFTDEDEWILQVFAETVVVALESAALIAQLTAKTDPLSRLVASSPDGMIAVDRDGKVTLFNKQAERILGYQANEVTNRPVGDLYFDPAEARKIGALLHASESGTLANYDTFVKSKTGEKIPIRHYSTWLFGTDGERIGSIGYFEDLRSIQEVERRLELLLNASTLVAQAKDLKTGLQSLAELLVSLFPHTFCRILLMDDKQQFLDVKASYYLSNTGKKQAMTSGLSHGLVVSEWPGLLELLELGDAELLWAGNDRIESTLQRLSKLLQLDADIQALFIVPLKIEDRVVGMLEFGEVQQIEQRPFTQAEKDFAEGFAAKITVLIDRMRLHDTTIRRGQLLEALHKASLHIRADRETSKNLREVVRLAAELIGCTEGGLFINYPVSREVELEVITGMFPRELTGKRLPITDGVIALVVQTGRSHLVRNYSTRTDREQIFEGFNIHTLAAIPLKHESGEIEAVLFVIDRDGQQQLNESDLEILEGFAAQASIALQTSRLLNHEQRMVNRLTTLYKFSEYIQASVESNKVLHVVLTGVTADYGLKFNRAAIFFLNDKEQMLVGRMGIGHLDEASARKDWNVDQRLGVNDLARYIELLEQGGLPLTPIARKIIGLRLPLGSGPSDAFWQAVYNRKAIIVSQNGPYSLPQGFIDAFAPGLPLIVAPLEARNQVIGILVSDNKFTQSSITREDEELLLTFVNTAAIAIDNNRLLEETLLGKQKLSALFKSSNELISSKDPHQVLRDIVEQTPTAANASWVRIILIDETGHPKAQFIGGSVLDPNLKEPIRPNGISMQVMLSGRPRVLEDTNEHRDEVNPYMIQNDIKAALCLPLSLQGKSIGVVWINYSEPREFLDFEVEALQLYVNQAAIAYDSADRVDKLERLHQAARSMSGVFNLELNHHSAVEHALHTIVTKAKEMFQADSSTLWSYDKDKFLPRELIGIGIGKQDLQIFKGLEPTDGGTTRTALEEGWINVPDISKEYSFLRPEMRIHLERSGIKSFQGIALKVGVEPVGVLYVSYNQPHNFDAAERRSLEDFATYAAPSLKNARLLDQVRQAQETARVVAKVTTLGDLKATLQSIAEGTLKAVHWCDAVVLYVYNDITDVWNYPPTHAGVKYWQRAWPNDIVPQDSIVFHMLNRDEPYIAENIAEDPFLNWRRFARDEGTKSLMALPLKAGDKRVGVMFVNSRLEFNKFTRDESNNINLFADQAAVAIRNTQLFEEVGAKLTEQQSLLELSQGLLGTLNLQQILERAVKFAADVLHADFCDIVLPNKDGTLIMSAVVGWEPEMANTYELAKETGSHTGFTIMKGEPVVVDDYTAETRFTILPIIRDHQISSGMSVPMVSDERVVGAMLVHTTKLHRFGDAEVKLLRLIANSTAIAIESAKRFQASERKSAYLNALYQTGKAITDSFGLDRKQILDQIVQPAVKGITGIEGPKAFLGTIQLYDKTTNELVFESVFPPEEYPKLVARLGERRSLTVEEKDKYVVGLTGLTVLNKTPYLIPNVKQNPYYVEFSPYTRSELTVPLMDHDEVLGVLNVESDQLGAFDDEDQSTLLALAEMIVIGIQNARQFLELKEVKGLVGSRTALAWMGMAYSAWRHTIEGHAINIRNVMTLLRTDLKTFDLSSEEQNQAEKRLQVIESQAWKIMEKKMTPPLSSEQGVEVILINNLIRERITQLWENESHQGIELEMNLGNDNVRVKLSPEWFRRAFDILVENAREAMVGCPQRRLTLVTRSNKNRFELAISDTGKGMSPEIREKLFQEQITKQQDSKGFGIGLLMVQAIFQTYGGAIRLGTPGPVGTTFIGTLPIEK
jgi:PAS domain S-box-containing protein